MRMLKIFFILLSMLYSTGSFATLKLPSVIDDNMVLQQGKANNIWGWATSGDQVTVLFRNKIYTAQTNKNGEWKVLLDPYKAWTTGNMEIVSKSEKKIIKNILVGEVWVCGGQSNMEYILSGYKDVYSHEMQTAKTDNIRFLVVKNSFDNKERNDAELLSSWSSIDTSNIGNCSAVAYFYAKKLQERLKVPVGLIISSWGGTPAQSWMDTASLKGFPRYIQLYDHSIKPLDFSQIEILQQKAQELFQQKIKKEAISFKAVTAINYDDSNWEKTSLPKIWESAGHPDLDGIAAYRISFTIAPGDENKTAVLHLPAVDDIDSTYINSVFLGSKNIWNELRVYDVPANILKAGKNVLTIWVEDDRGGGGLNEDVANYYLQLQDKRIWLKGEARFKILLPVETIAAGVNYESMKTQPGILFNAMIAPLLSYGIRGAIWYQGESNVPDFVEYRSLFPAMIKAWRKRFNQGDFPFLFVQLASYNPAITEPELSDWAFLREAQAGALKLPNTGMAVATDIGDQLDLHPKRKKEVGERLAANAFNIVYGFKNEVPAGPIYKSSLVKDNTVRISFSNIGKGLLQKGNKLLGFTIAAADKHFIEANAVIEGNEIIVSNASVRSPLYVRYAWANAPLDANLYNKEGFPAAPFRTDK